MTEKFIRFFRQSRLSFMATFGWLEPKNYILVKIITPLLQMLFFCLVAKFAYKTENIMPWVVGNAFLMSISNCVFGMGTISMIERIYGTLKVVVVAPANKFITFIQRGFFHVIDSYFSVIIGLIVGGLIFNVSYEGVNLLLLSLVIAVAMFAAASFGLLISSFGLVITQINIFTNTVSSLLLIFTGANFPISKLPYIAQKFSYCLPLTRSIMAARNLMLGNTNMVYELLIGEVIIGVIYIIIGYVVMRFVESISQKYATIDLF